MKTRKQIRLKNFDYSSGNYYYITICCYKRKCLLASEEEGNIFLKKTGLIVNEYLKQIPYRYEEAHIDVSVIMPNHIHFVLAKDEGGASIVDIVKWLKSVTTAKCLESKLINDHLWQRNYYEHIVRSERALDGIREYIVNNPLKWHLDKENPRFVN